jgi:hypothetical protein
MVAVSWAKAETPTKAKRKRTRIFVVRRVNGRRDLDIERYLDRRKSQTETWESRNERYPNPGSFGGSIEEIREGALGYRRLKSR